MVLAVVVFREHLGRRGIAAAALVIAGAIVLSAGPIGGRLDIVGVLAIAGACVAWGLDNNLSQRLSLRDPVRVAQVKASGAAIPLLIMAFVHGDLTPSAGALAGLLAVGAAGYGISIVLDLHALRLLGAGREAAVFATAPFVGALFAVLALGSPFTIDLLLAAILMAAGVLVLLRETHEHDHVHRWIEHEHRHSHDDGHHDHHAHPVQGAHSHVHEHVEASHRHPHVSDAHHRHEH